MQYFFRLFTGLAAAGRRHGLARWRLLPAGLLLLASLAAHAQLQASQWYFGQQAGMDFRATAPVALTNGQLNTYEGCSSRADSLGNLLFYTDGDTVWNRQHQVMAGGIGLVGNRSTTQCLVVPWPGRPQHYYIFTPSERALNTGLQYSVVDMAQQGGLGAVTQRNVSLWPSSTERVTAVPHTNHRDQWIIAHEQNTNRFTVFLLTPTGLVPTPVFSSDAFVHTGVRAIGQLKASPNGQRLALAVDATNRATAQQEPSVELLNFDASTGLITNPLVFNAVRLGSYGVEFSPDGTKLYITDPLAGLLHQYDMTVANIQASRVQIGASSSSKNALQLGLDGRIYVAHIDNVYGPALGVIQEPNRAGVACGYVDNGFPLAGRLSSIGLPSFSQPDLWQFAVEGACQGAALRFMFPTTYGPDSVRWNFGDPAAGPANTSRLPSPTHRYAVAGTYSVTLTLCFGLVYRRVLRRTVAVQPLPQVALGRDTALCPRATTLLRVRPSLGGATYRWQDGSTAQTLLAQQPGWYWVEATSAAGCTMRDSLRVSALPLPTVELGPDTVVCVGQALTLRSRRSQAGLRYRWSNGTTGATLMVTAPAVYWLQVTNAAGCSQRDSIRVIYLTPPTIYLGPDTTLCQNAAQPFVLDATLPGVGYHWQDGSTQATFRPAQSGTYWVTVSTAICSVTDSIRVGLYDCQENLFVPNIITPNGDGRNDQLEIIGLGLSTWSLSVYNRWGRLVYLSDHYKQDWDAIEVPAGLYYYLLREPISQRRFRGWVEVVK